ncbi:hypothetical protein NFI96_009581 [Prochilodus magdalenae]|nr:hypothetical protein NFI96_009581 [Prochilodus magdalenae]
MNVLSLSKPAHQPLQVYSSMEHLSQLEQKTPVVTRREQKGRREDKMAKRESFGSFSKSWRTGSPEMKRLSCSESLYSEGDSSPPLGARRRFSALMDTHRFASPLESNGETQPQQSTRSRGSSLESTATPPSPAHEQSTSVKEGAAVTAGGEKRGEDECTGLCTDTYQTQEHSPLETLVTGSALCAGSIG